jgi:hypothetical protein
MDSVFSCFPTNRTVNGNPKACPDMFDLQHTNQPTFHIDTQMALELELYLSRNYLSNTHSGEYYDPYDAAKPLNIH